MIARRPGPALTASLADQEPASLGKVREGEVKRWMLRKMTDGMIGRELVDAISRREPT
jgi:hypothetical protein